MDGTISGGREANADRPLVLLVVEQRDEAMLVELPKPADGRRSRDVRAKREVTYAKIFLRGRKPEEDQHQVPGGACGVEGQEVSLTLLAQAQQSPCNLAAVFGRPVMVGDIDFNSPDSKLLTSDSIGNAEC